MRFLIICAVAMLLVSCDREPEFFIDGKPYYTKSVCTESVTETVYEYHYGYHLGKYKWHWGNNTTTTCIESRIDTIEIK